MTDTNASLFRVDKFVVPAPARDAFLSAVRSAQQIVALQPGCVRNQVLEQVGGSGEFNFVSIVEWASAREMEQARHAIAQHHAQNGVDIEAFRARNGIRVDVATYRDAFARD
jgi:heme-degrading monooxygenase HmoA